LDNRIHFVDANIPMYAVGAQHPLKQPCLTLLEAIAKDDLIAVTNVEVLQEILHRYTALGQRARAVEVAELFLRVVPQVLPVTLQDFRLAMELHGRHATIQARDSLHVAVMQQNGISRIISADRHFDSIPGITRLDPAHWPI